MDGIFSHLEAPPPMPVARNPDAFIDWAAEHRIKPIHGLCELPGCEREGDRVPRRRGRHQR